jgi:glucan 1,3-beta-glucosidase
MFCRLIKDRRFRPFLYAAYKKENCENDPDWCFIAAVGKKRLSPTFFSFQSVQGNRAQSQSSTHSSSRRSDWFATSPLHHHRFESIQHRRDRMWQQYSAEVQPSKGYTDGFTTAKVFASHNMSKLGFTGQYMDIITKAGQILDTEKDYKDAFMRGLIAGENMVQSAAASWYPMNI